MGDLISGGAYKKMYFLFTEGLTSRGALISDSLRYTSFDHTTSFNVLSCPHEMHPF